DRRDRREIARHERQHAGREEGEEARAEGDDDGGSAHGSKRASSSSSRRSSAGSSGSGSTSPGGSSSRRRLHRHASAPTTAAPRTRPRSGSTQATSSKPFLGGTASTAGPNWSTRAALISLFVSPAAIRSRMYAFIRSATGAFEVSSVVSQTGQTSSDSSSAAV